MISRHLSMLLTLTCLLLPAGAGALTYVLVADDHLSDQADLVARLEVGPPRVDRFGGTVMTEYTASVVETVKGHVSGDSIVLRVPGGIDLERELFFKLFGAPRIAEGERVLAFLRQREDGSYRILHILQGLFREMEYHGDRLYMRSLLEARQLAPDGSVVHGIDPARDAGRFENWVRDRIAGFEREADYWVDLPSQVSRQFLAKFTIQTFDAEGDETESVLRWFEFDAEKKVKWKRHPDGQDGLKKKGKTALKNAVAAWNEHSEAPILLKAQGKSSTTSLDCDGKNVLLFEDAPGIIGDPYVCGVGGTLAVAGPNCGILDPVPWKRTDAYEVTDAVMVTNAGTSCYWEVRDERADEVFTHEIGHTLGLGHSCGDDFSPGCSLDSAIADATMAAFAHDDLRGASLRRDDILGARYLYDPDYDAAWCAEQEPGTKKFCKKCGPCGAGQGDCKNKDKRCLDGLECVQDVGADFGFDDKVDVCLPPAAEG